jgi:hypothetical protein
MVSQAHECLKQGQARYPIAPLQLLEHLNIWTQS